MDAIAPDGSPVSFYAALDDDGDSAQLVHENVPDEATVLELGAGTGRVTRPLVTLGHRVTAVDESADMLAHIATETVRSSIQNLRLGRTYDVVLLMSRLIGSAHRRALLDACRRHVADGGSVIIERPAPAWFDAAAPGTWQRGDLHLRMYDVSRPAPDELCATIEYRKNGRVWTHSFCSRRLADSELPEVLAASGLRLGRFLDADRT
jgi:SAM-dependent methyltransferase